jgi:hypothetical protein
MAAPVEASVFLTGAASDGGAQTDPNAALGNYRSSTKLVSGNNISAPVNVTGLSGIIPSLFHDFKPVTGTLTNNGNTVKRASLLTPTGAATWRPSGGQETLILNPGAFKADPVLDSSGGAKTVTEVGDATTDTFEAFFDGKSIRIDNTEDINFPDSTDFDLGVTGSGNDWEMDFYIMLDTTATHEWFGNFDGTNGWRVALETNTIRLFAGGAESSVSWTPVINIWYHINIAKVGTTITVEVDGSSIGTLTDRDLSTGTDIFSLGNGNTAAGANFRGYFANFSLKKAGTTVLLLTPTAAVGSSTILDESASNHTPTNTGTPTVDRKDPFQGSIGLDGTGDRLTLVDNADWDVGAGDFSLSCYINAPASAGNDVIINQWQESGNQRSWQLMKLIADTVIFQASFDGTAIGVSVTSTTVIADDTWHYIEITKVGNVYRLFVDGTEEDTDTVAGTIHDSTVILMVGAQNPNSPSNHIIARLDNIVLNKGFARHTSNYTSPTERLSTTQKIEFTANSEALVETILDISATDEMALSSTPTSFLDIDTGVGLTNGSALNITVNDAIGVITYTTATTLLQYTAPGDTIGSGVDIGIDGTYTIRSSDPSLYIEVTVVAASLPGTDETDNLTITRGDNIDNLFDTVSIAEGAAGDIEYRALIVKNEQASILTAFEIYIDRQTPLETDDVEIAVEELVTSKIQTIANESTAPTAVTFSKPTLAAPLTIVGTNLAVNGMIGIWMKRTITAGGTLVPQNNFQLGFKYEIP